MPYEALSKARLTKALRRLSALATAEGLVLELALYGGAVFTLVYGSRETTKDVDAIIKPAEAGARLVKVVATEQNLSADWLNGEVQQFLSHCGERRPYPSQDFAPGLRITIPTAAYLLALKLNACRQPLPGHLGDEADILFLLARIKPASVTAVEAIHDRFFPGEGLHGDAVELIEEYLEGKK
ncbi:MAG: hypothetical protein NTX09_06855 [Verrucomicrobia bacterium]|nr:hypothetical protein [Verrucomicrobiota bacterium]